MLPTHIVLSAIVLRFVHSDYLNNLKEAKERPYKDEESEGFKEKKSRDGYSTAGSLNISLPSHDIVEY